MDGHKEGHVEERSNPRRDKPGHQHHGKSTNQKNGRRRQGDLIERRMVHCKSLILQASDNPGINDHGNQNRRQERNQPIANMARTQDISSMARIETK